MTTRGDEDVRADDLAPLLLAAGRGDAAAWVELVDRYSRRVFALAKSRCRNNDVAEELTQSVFATVATKLGAGEYLEKGRFESWLFRVAMNRVRDHLRRSKRQPISQDSEQLERRPELRPAEPVFDPAAYENLRLAMDALTDSDREIIELRHHGGLSFKQISELLDEPMGTLLARHHRALKKLREAIDHRAATPTGELTP